MTVSRSNEPNDPSPHRGRYRLAWVVSWIVLASAGSVVLAVLWVADADVELLAVVGAAVAIAVAVPLYHLVVTQDVGEHEVARDLLETDRHRGGVDRRRLLAAGGAGLVAAVAGVVGLRRYVPPQTRATAWSSGSKLVTITGGRLRPGDVPIGGVVTVWPESAVGTERAAVMVIRLRERPMPPTRLDGVVDETLVAYSRLCTHAGCAVALYRDRDQALFCPCHQATFDARRGATPTGGPASIPLPQLPLGIDDSGDLIAVNELTRRPGPVGGEGGR